jgi:uncharacterized protein
MAPFLPRFPGDLAIMAAFVLHVPDIDADGKTYVFPLTTAWVKNALAGSDLRADESAPEGVVKVFAQRSGADVLVTGAIDTRILADCVRCLEDAPVVVHSEIGSLFTARGEDYRPPADEDELTPEELAREHFTGDDIALDELVREQIILEVPMQPLCREDCPGIEVPAHVRPPADFGETRQKDEDGVDPRFAALRTLAGKLASKKE